MGITDEVGPGFGHVGEQELDPARVGARAQTVASHAGIALRLDFGYVVTYADAARESHVMAVAPMIRVHEPGVIAIEEHVQSGLHDGLVHQFAEGVDAVRFHLGGRIGWRGFGPRDQSGRVLPIGHMGFQYLAGPFQRVLRLVFPFHAA